MMKITGLSHIFKWENLHNWWLTKYFFAPLYNKWHISVVHLSDEEPACSKRYTLCDSFLIINLLIFLELWCCRLCIPNMLLIVF